ncbi:unnamed protein product [Sphagnum jensenii]|uniref:rhamnogalacturonan endolyase n=1 Tax=Sphagnum jensenii TaxID=128206 RepID=A0ABP0V8R4_9BRYO
MVDIYYSGDWGELHYVVFNDVNGIYSYFVATGIGEVGEFRTLYRVDGNMFRNGHNAERSGAFPTLDDIKKATKLQDQTFALADGKTIHSKYDWASYVADDHVHGVYGEEHGVWLITSSHEYFNGGPMKQELMVHVESSTGDGVVLNMLSAGHFGTPAVKIPNGKIYGPWLLYFNDGSIDDAEKMAKTEATQWPYKWLSNPHYPLSRSTVTGTLNLKDKRPASGAMIVLAKPGGDLYSQGTDYIFYSKADSSGVFSIPHVRPGTYSLYAFATGGSIGDITDQFEKDNVKVEGSHTDVGALTWSPPQYSHILWQIGTADRKVTEFKLGNLPRQFGLFKKVAPTLTYTIGKSKPSEDWYYAQTQAGNWTVDFNVDKTYSGNAHLTVATAGQARKATVEIVVNGHVIQTLPSYTNDASIYRCANPSGYYHLAVVSFLASHLKTGANSLTFHATHVDDGGGKMYDTIKLEVE